MRCKHGFDPETGPGLWCPACDVEEPWWKQAWLWFVRKLFYRWGDQ